MSQFNPNDDQSNMKTMLEYTELMFAKNDHFHQEGQFSKQIAEVTYKDYSGLSDDLQTLLGGREVLYPWPGTGQAKSLLKEKVHRHYERTQEKPGLVESEASRGESEYKEINATTSAAGV